ncbi:MAG: hypothetical protein KatS3mg059_1305 [Thermomicrobiales bacterium]|nr:MAG: hypothetical protein KatS3mg059_1305 [Thermomicrobiales bacterium]
MTDSDAQPAAAVALEPPMLTVSGERVALGPLRRDLLPQYQRWINDLGAAQNLGMIPRPVTQEAEAAWYDRMVAGNDILFTIYERSHVAPHRQYRASRD